MESVTSSQGSFADRNGNLSESMFRVFADHKGFSIERYGFDRTNLRNFFLLPEFIRSTPDFVVTSGRRTFFVECKAGGNGAAVNFVKGNIPPLATWNTYMPLYLFFNDSEGRQIAFLSFSDFIDIYAAHKHTFTEGRWQSGAEYYAMPKTLFTWTNYRDF